MSILRWLLTLRFPAWLNVKIHRFIPVHNLTGNAQTCSSHLETMRNIYQSNYWSNEIEIPELNNYKKYNGHTGLNHE